MDVLYSVMQGLESRLGGGEGVEGIYGSITATGVHKILECMRHNCGLGRSSTLVDIGAGLGRPLLHALLLHGIAHGYGVELDTVKVSKAQAFCKGVLAELALRGVLSSKPASRDTAAAAAGASPEPSSAAVAVDPTAAGEEGQAGSDSNAATGGDGRAQAGCSSQGHVLASSDGAVHPVGSQGCCMNSSQADSCTAINAADAAAAAVAGGGDDQGAADDTQTQVDCSQTSSDTAGNTAAGPQAAGQQQHKQHEQQQTCPAPDADKKAASAAAAGAKAKVKGAPLVWPASRPIITCAAIEQVASLTPCTHAYSFWEGVPLSGKRAFGQLFRTSHTLKAVAVVQRAMRGAAPEAVMAELGFGPLLLIKAFPVNMSGSGRSFTAYIFSKVAPPSAMLLMRCSAAAAGNTATTAQQQQPEADVLASTSKPNVGRARTSQGSRNGAAVGAAVPDAVQDRSCPDQQQQGPQQLIQLLTEESIAAMQQQQHQGCSPAKRCQPFLLAAAAAAGGDADADGSPSKRQRDSGSSSQPGPAAAGAAGGVATRASSGLYGLRPRQLYSSNSGGGSSSQRSSGTTSTGAGAAQRGSGSQPAGAAVRRSGLRSSSSISRASSMSVDQPVGSRRRGAVGSRSTAVSGGSRNSRAKAASKQQQQQHDGGCGGDREGGSRQQGGSRSVPAAVSDVRAAVAVLDV